MYNIDVIFISDAKDAYFKALTTSAIKSLLKSEDPQKINFNIYVVESNPVVVYDNAITMRPTKPFGYNKFCNYGISRSSSEYLALCNNDISFEKGWASNIIKVMEEDPAVLSAGSVCPEIHQHGKFDIEYEEGYSTRDYVTGWMIFQKRKLYDIIGLLDEDFIFWYSDDYYAAQLIHNNIKHVRVNTSIVHHHENSVGETANSINDIDELTYGQRKLYESKIFELNNRTFDTSPINEYFDRVYCLNLEKDKERYSQMEKIFDFLHLDVKRWVATTPLVLNQYSNYVNISPNYLATLNSHLSIIEDAVNDDLDRILIIEDDIVPLKNLNTDFKKIQDYGDLPDDWDLLYLSYIRTNDSKSEWTYVGIEDDLVNNHLAQAKNFWSGMAYGISRNLMERTLNYFKNNPPMEIDRFYVDLIQKQDGLFNSYGIFPQMFAGVDNYSNNTNLEESIFERSINSKYQNKKSFYFPD